MHSINRFFDRMGRRMDEMFESMDLWMDSMLPEHHERDFEMRRTVSTVHVRKGKNKVVITIDVPGLTAKNITITLQDGILAVQAKGRPSKGRIINIERKFQVAPSTDISDVAASVKNGMLTIKVERDEVPEKPKGVIKVNEG